MRLLSRFSCMTILAALVAACRANAPEVLTLDGEYVAQCSGMTMETQCFTQQSPSNPQWIDSARVVFHNDGTASWMRALGDEFCNPFTTPITCNPPTLTLSRFDSSYSVIARTLVRTARYDMVAAAPFKSPGPSELDVSFATPWPVRFLRVR